MHATNMTTAELVRYGLMYSDSLPASVSRDALERLEDAVADCDAAQRELDSVRRALEVLGISDTPADRLPLACDDLAMRCDQADRMEQLLLKIAKRLESGRLNKADREELAQDIYDEVA